MNKELLDSYRIINPSPTNDYLDVRESAINRIIINVLTQQDLKLLLKYAQGSLVGYESERNSIAVTNLSNFLREYESDFPKDFTDNSLELQVLSAMVIGEIFSKFSKDEEVYEMPGLGDVVINTEVETDEEEEESDEEEAETEDEKVEPEKEDLMKHNAFFASVFFISGSNLRTSSQPRHLALLKKKLDILAAGTIEYETELQDNLKGEFSKTTFDVLSALLTDFSKSIGAPFSSVNAFDAAFACAKDIVASGNVLPNLEKQKWISQVVNKNRKNKDLKVKKLFNIFELFTDVTLDSFSSLNSQNLVLINEFPIVFPISWVCIRLAEGANLNDLKREFEQKTLLSLAEAYSPETIGKQIFFEMISQNIYITNGEEYL